MPHLTELHIGRVDLTVDVITRALFGLTDLKSLGFRHRHMEGQFVPFASPIQHLTRLTRLDTDLMCSVASICHLTDLVILRVSIVHQPFFDDCPSLNLKLLEELDVHMHSRFEGRIFSDLSRLKRLCIQDDYAENGDVLTPLRRLTQLSSFSFTGNFVDRQLPLRYCLQFNLLASLRSLSICVTSRHPKRIPDPRDFLLGGSFPLLRYLHLDGFQLSSDDECELKRRFPCLNSLSGM